MTVVVIHRNSVHWLLFTEEFPLVYTAKPFMHDFAVLSVGQHCVIAARHHSVPTESAEICITIPPNSLILNLVSKVFFL